MNKKPAVKKPTILSKDKSSFTQMRGKMAMIEEQLGFRDTEINELHEALEQGENRIRDLSNKLATERGHNDSKEFIIMRLTAELEMVRQLHASLISNLSYEIAELRSKCRELETLRTSLSLQLAEAKKVELHVNRTKQRTAD